MIELFVPVKQIIMVHLPIVDPNAQSTLTVLETKLAKITNVLTLVLVHVVKMPFVELSIIVRFVLAIVDILEIRSRVVV
jgi:hypothetical protein